MNTLKNIKNQENDVIACIKNGIAVTDFTLKKHFRDYDIDKDRLNEILDNLIYEERIRRVYPEESQVAVYTLVE